MSMTGDAVKAFIYLLTESWLQTPRATLPNNDKDLASMARISEEKWMVIKNEVLPCFKIGECEEHKGLLYNDTLLEISRNYENKQRVGNKNAKQTRIKRKTNAKSPIAFAFAFAFASVFSDASESFKKAWYSFVEMRIRIKKPPTEHAIDLLLEKLKSLSNGNEKTAIAILNESTMNNWQGIFPLRENFNKSKKEENNPYAAI